MYLSFIYPFVLVLLLLLVPLWWLALGAPRRLARGRFWASLLLRTALFTVLIGSLAGTQLVQRVSNLTTVFLVDSSDSVAPAARAAAETFIRQALDTMPVDDRAAIVVFGENALVERAPSLERGLRRLESVPVAARTNIGAALELGLALLPGDTQKRLVLLSDGGENAGEVQRALDFARARGVGVDVVSLATGTGADLAQVDEVRVPSEAREGQTVNVDVTVSAQAATAATLRLKAGSVIVSEQTVQLTAGRQTFSFPVLTETAGFSRYTAEIEVLNDERRQNNQASALLNVTGEPRVLVIEGVKGDAQNLAAALTAAKMNPEVVPPASLPPTLAALASYDAVVLVNTHAGALPASAMQTLPAYVRELGRGLVMVGGDRGFGVGGYNKTAIEAALPVDMEVKDTSRRPDVALVFVLDKSGSMAACHCAGPNMQNTRQDGGVQKVDIGKDAIIQASALLRDQDHVGVVAFDDAPDWVVQTQRKPSSDALLAALKGVTPDGTTNVREGLLAAKASLEKTDATVKHIILLTDGWSSGSDNLDLARALQDEGITLSTVAAGGGSAPFLENLANTGGGRYYAVENMEDVPQIFVEETIRIAGAYVIEQTFVPILSGDSPILSGLTNGGWPQLLGYNGTEAKDTAQVILQAPDGYPLLAQWQYGLGRSVAWTSDFKGQWGRDLVTWDQFARFGAQLVAWTLPRREAGLISGATRTAGLSSVITAQLQNEGQPITDAQVNGVVVGADGSQQEITLRQIAPGEFQATLPSPVTGSYLVQLTASRNGELLGSETVGLVVPYSPEYRQREANPALLEAIATSTNGQVLTTAADVFRHDLAAVRRAREIGLFLLLLAALLLPLDIAVRRLGVRRQDLAALRGMLPQRRATVTAQAAPIFGALRRAKARANTRIGPTNDVTPSEQPSTLPPRRARVERPSSAETASFRDAPDAAPTPTPPDAMARLRAAKERARKRND